MEVLQGVRLLVLPTFYSPGYEYIKVTYLQPILPVIPVHI